MTNLACSLFCQGAIRFGGEGWVGSHGVVGAGSYWVTSPREGVRVTPQNITHNSTPSRVWAAEYAAMIDGFV